MNDTGRGPARRGWRRGHPLVALVAVALAAAACGSGAGPASPGGASAAPDVPAPAAGGGIPVGPGTRSLDKGWYRWGDPDPTSVGRAGVRTLAEGVETFWDPSLGIVILGPEETNGRLSQLILEVGPGASNGPLPIRAATLSWTARRVGSLARGDAELYDGPVRSEFRAEVRVEERGPNYLKGTFSVALKKAAVLVGGAELDDRAETLLLGGTFVAIEP